MTTAGANVDQPVTTNEARILPLVALFFGSDAVPFTWKLPTVPVNRAPNCGSAIRRDQLEAGHAARPLVHRMAHPGKAQAIDAVQLILCERGRGGEVDHAPCAVALEEYLARERVLVLVK